MTSSHPRRPESYVRPFFLCRPPLSVFPSLVLPSALSDAGLSKRTFSRNPVFTFHTLIPFLPPPCCLYPPFRVTVCKGDIACAQPCHFLWLDDTFSPFDKIQRRGFFVCGLGFFAAHPYKLIFVVDFSFSIMAANIRLSAMWHYPQP